MTVLPRVIRLVLIVVLLLVCLPAPAQAYIGPGAGFAVISSFLVTVLTGLLALLSLAAWPFRILWRRIRNGRRPRPQVGRLIVVGLSGQDPDLTDRLIESGRLPNFRVLAGQGHCTRMTVPSFASASEAWSAFATGAEQRDGRDPFWLTLGHHGIWSVIHFVPLPLRRFHGLQLNTTGSSCPAAYARYLSARIDASANPRPLDDNQMRQAMFFAALDRLDAGALVAIFAPNGVGDTKCAHNDAFVGDVLERLRADDTLIVLSDRGILFSTRPIVTANPSIFDLVPTVLHLFGIDRPEDMRGRLLVATDQLREVVA